MKEIYHERGFTEQKFNKIFLVLRKFVHVVKRDEEI